MQPACELAVGDKDFHMQRNQTPKSRRQRRWCEERSRDQKANSDEWLCVARTRSPWEGCAGNEARRQELRLAVETEGHEHPWVPRSVCKQ